MEHLSWRLDPINQIRGQDDIKLTNIRRQFGRIANLESATFAVQIERQFPCQWSCHFALFPSPDFDSPRLTDKVCRGDKAMRQIDPDDFRCPTREFKGGPP